MAGSVYGKNGKRLKASDSPKAKKAYAANAAKGMRTFKANRKSGKSMPNATMAKSRTIPAPGPKAAGKSRQAILDKAVKNGIISKAEAANASGKSAVSRAKAAIMKKKAAGPTRAEKATAARKRDEMVTSGPGAQMAYSRPGYITNRTVKASQVGKGDKARIETAKKRAKLSLKSGQPKAAVASAFKRNVAGVMARYR